MVRLTVPLAFAALACAQNPYTTLPKNYRLELENDSVRVSRVKYFPGDKLPVHAHPSIPTVYVYVTDGGSIRFLHTSPKFTIDRPAVKAGGVRFNRNSRAETHEVEYLSDAPTEYLRIELKTKPGPPRLDTRLRADADFPWEDPQVKISRFHGLPAKVTRPAVLVNVSERSFAWLDPKRPNTSSRAREADWFVMVELMSGSRGDSAR
jgi:hypothetical protein